MRSWMPLAIFATALAFGPAFANDDDDDDDDHRPDRGRNAAEIVVRCDRGRSINDAIALADGSSRLTIIVRGTCVERVSIGTDNVTVRGDAAVGGRVEGRFFVDARRVVIENLTISGDDRGIRAFHGAYVSVRDVVIENMTETGIFAVNAGVAIVERVTVTGPVTDGFSAGTGGILDIRDSVVEGAEFGISAGYGASVNIERTSILGSTGDGLQILQGSSARVVEARIEADAGIAISVAQAGFMTMRNSDVTSTSTDAEILFLDGGGIRLDGGNVLTGTSPFNSFTIRNGSYLRQRTNLGDGPDSLTGRLSVESQSVASLSRMDLNGDVSVVRHAELELRADEPGTVTIDGNIDIAEDSLLLFRASGGNVDGNVVCRDDESSLSIVSATVSITGITDCSGFD